MLGRDRVMKMKARRRSRAGAVVAATVALLAGFLLAASPSYADYEDPDLVEVTLADDCVSFYVAETNSDGDVNFSYGSSPTDLDTTRRVDTALGITDWDLPGTTVYYRATTLFNDGNDAYVEGSFEMPACADVVTVSSSCGDYTVTNLLSNIVRFDYGTYDDQLGGIELDPGESSTFTASADPLYWVADDGGRLPAGHDRVGDRLPGRLRRVGHHARHTGHTGHTGHSGHSAHAHARHADEGAEGRPVIWQVR